MCSQNFDSQFADKVARLCYEKFEELPKSGKPVRNEWTYLAAIVQLYEGNMEVVSIATGSKCIGRNKLSPSGDLVNDSHAEVLARRGFLKYLYEQIKCAKWGGKSNILTVTDSGKMFSVLRNVTFHLFSSHVPCGDAAIFPKYVAQRVDRSGNAPDPANNSGAADDPATKKRKIECGIPPSYEVGQIIEDIHRTGAKCLPNETNPDQKQCGTNYHVVGRVRTKPGRGDPTLSVSCSDKILRWNCVGIQGALLSILLEPAVYLSSIVIGSHGGLYSEEALRRAVIDRNSLVKKICRRPALLHSDLEFKFCRRRCDTSGKSAPAAVVWSNVPEKNHEVIVEGRRLGWTKKTSSRAQPVSIAKRMFLQAFKSVTENKYENFSYHDVKQQAISYQEEWRNAKNAIGLWTLKSTDLIQFK